MERLANWFVVLGAAALVGGCVTGSDTSEAPTKGTDGKCYFLVRLPGHVGLYRQVKQDEAGRWVNDGEFFLFYMREDSLSFGAPKAAAGESLLRASFRNGDLVNCEMDHRTGHPYLEYNSLTSTFQLLGSFRHKLPENWHETFNKSPDVRALRDAMSKPTARVTVHKES